MFGLSCAVFGLVPLVLCLVWFPFSLSLFDLSRVYFDLVSPCVLFCLVSTFAVVYVWIRFCAVFGSVSKCVLFGLVTLAFYLAFWCFFDAERIVLHLPKASNKKS